MVAYVYCGNDPVNYIDTDGAAPTEADRQRMLQTANHWVTLHTKYVWGGTGQKGIDCSGLVYRIIQSVNPGVPRLTAQGYLNSPLFKPITPGQAKPGDFIYFPPGNVMVRNHATGKVETHFQKFHHIGHVKSSSTFIGAQSHGTAVVNFKTDPYWSQRPPTFLRYVGPTNTSLSAGRPSAPSSPSPVGGVALSGGGNSLAEFGPLEGVSVDAQGRLVLLSKGKGEIDLPPLRLDDVVTVFRSVYDHGEAPFVSIDPEPTNPTGPVMNIRHGPGTANTYVGWVLFESDRAMKTYSLGKDNLTGKPFVSKIPGYETHLNLRFTDVSTVKGQERWERFWIVPSEVTHRVSKDGRTTLAQVPLKLRTESMVLRGGKLVTAPNGQSSKGAAFFTKWFTDNYSKIAQEARSPTPKGSGMDGEVAVFAELQRIAVIAAVAERLHLQGVPMPAWMRDYPVKPFPFGTTTPSTTVESEKKVGKDVFTYSIYGGVTLSPPKEAVKIVPFPEAEALAPTVQTALADAPALALVSVEGERGEWKAAALPGSDAVGVGANHLAEADLVVPLADGHDVRLVRQFDSFQTPTDVFGPAWSLDLPRLTKRLGKPSETEPGKYQVYFELDTPLHSVSGVFAETGVVPELSRELYIPATAGEMLGLSNTKDDGNGTQHIYFRDGRRWHFDDKGDLIAIEQLPLKLRFHRDADRRLVKIEGTCGSRRASIALEYDDRGRVLKATDSDNRSTTYAYDTDGRLERVTRPGGKVGYEYRGAQVAAVLEDGAAPRRFEYTASGQLLAERTGTDGEVKYDVVSRRDGTAITARGTAPGAVAEVSEFDARFRPTRQTFGDGTRVAWKYSADGTTEVTTTPAEGLPVVVKASADGRRAEYRVPGIEPQAAEFDSAGRLLSLRQGEQVVLTRKWLPNGLPESETDATTVRRFEYRADGSPAGVRITPMKAGGAGRSVNVEFDADGRPATVTDDSGAVIAMKYDSTGRPVSVTSSGSEVVLTTDAAAHTHVVKTSWGEKETIEFDPASGQPRRVDLLADGKTSFAEYDRGRPKRVHQFDGGEFTLTYPDRPDAPPDAARTPNGLALAFEYGDKSRVKTVRCGDAYRTEYEYDAQGRLIGLRLTAVVR